jgi:predicted 3-demethylubiquinone-9 3-methyltransferase (glyoxalase superfamily)
VRRRPGRATAAAAVTAPGGARPEAAPAAVSARGRAARGGALKDRWGPIVPRRLHELLGDANPDRARRALEAMLRMCKLDIAELEHAADGRGLNE